MGEQAGLLFEMFPMNSLCVKFQPSSTPPSDRFWWGALVLVLLVLVLVLLVTGV